MGDEAMVRLCACGCGREIIIRPHHKYYGIPRYISGHNPQRLKHGEGIKKWKEKDPEAFLKHQKEAGKKAYKSTQEKHPDFNKRALERWKINNPYESRRVYSEAGKVGGKIGGKNTIQKHPHLMHHNAIKSNSLQTKRGFISKPEKIMRCLLPSDFLHGEELGGFIPDFHSKERKIVIEVDGKYWHSFEEIKRKDSEKTKYFQSMGYAVFRIPEMDVYRYFECLIQDNKQKVGEMNE
jgi:very-short-patch-repair endonuclease